MAEEKTYVFGEGAGNNGILSLLGPMLSQRGVDPNVLLAMQGRNNDGFGEGGWFIWVIFLFFLMGWGGNGFGNNGAGGLGNQLNNDYGREMLLETKCLQEWKNIWHKTDGILIKSYVIELYLKCAKEELMESLKR